MADRTDLDLVACVVRRNVDAYSELRRRHLSSVTAVARMVLGTRAGCEDVVSEVFVAFWLSPERFEPERGTLLAFLRLKVRGRSIDLLRADSARTRREVTRGVDALEPDVDARMIDAEAVDDVRTALDQLPAILRNPIELAFFSGMTYHTVALRLDLPEGTVKSRIRKGLRLMEQMEGLQLLRTDPAGDQAVGGDTFVDGGRPPNLTT